MAKERKNGLIKSIFKMALTIPGLIGMVSYTYNRVVAEFKVIGKNLIYLLLLSLVILTLLISTWISLQSILFFYLVSLQLNLLLCSFIIFLINLIILIIVGVYTAKIKKRIISPNAGDILQEIKNFNK